jgi:hypothetical protein
MTRTACTGRGEKGDAALPSGKTLGNHGVNRREPFAWEHPQYPRDHDHVIALEPKPEQGFIEFGRIAFRPDRAPRDDQVVATPGFE